MPIHLMQLGVLFSAGVAKPAILLNVEELLAAGMEEVHIIVQASGAAVLLARRMAQPYCLRCTITELPVLARRDA